MTKQQEIQILKTAIATLGEGSYLGPWLNQVSAEVENNIRSDFFPVVTLTESQHRAEAIIADANLQAEAIIATAKNNAHRIEQSAVKYQAEICENIRQALRDLNR